MIALLLPKDHPCLLCTHVGDAYRQATSPVLKQTRIQNLSPFGIVIGDAFLEAASCTTIRVSYISYNRRRGLVNRVSFMAQPKGVAARKSTSPFI